MDEINEYAGGHYGLNHALLPPDTSPIAERGDGAYIFTESGHKYIDYVLGSGPIICGHSHPDIVEAIRDQAKNGTQFILSTRPPMELTRRIVDAVPCAEKLIFTCTGSQAVYYALRLSRSHTGNDKIMKFAGAYHGYHDTMLKSTSRANACEILSTQYPEGTQDSAGVLSSTKGETIIAPYNDLQTTADIVEENANNLAAIIVEPMQRSLPPDTAFLHGLRDLCDQHNIVLIFDEIVTGFRLAWGGAQEKYGVLPDLATYGKTISGGTPIGAVCGSKEIMKLADPQLSSDSGGCFVSSTLNSNPLCAAAGNAALDVLEKQGTYDHLNSYADEFRSMIDDILSDSDLCGQTLGDGPVVDYIITDESSINTWPDIIKSDTEMKRRIDSNMIENGIMLKPGGKKYISLAHGSDELEKTKEALQIAISEVS